VSIEQTKRSLHLCDEVISRRLLSEASSLAYAAAPALVPAFVIRQSVIEGIYHPVEKLIDTDRVEHRGPAVAIEGYWEAVISKNDGEQVPLGIDPEERSRAASLAI
jgi:hypothetical protein